MSKGESKESDGGWTSVEGDLFRLLGYNCRQLKLEKVSQGFFRSQSWIPISQSRTSQLYRTSQIQPHRIRTHRVNPLTTHSTPLPQEVVLKYARYCSAMTVERYFCMVSKVRKNDSTNLGRCRRLVLPTNMLPFIRDEVQSSYHQGCAREWEYNVRCLS